jgi:hypothetical protein
VTPWQPGFTLFFSPGFGDEDYEYVVRSVSEDGRWLIVTSEQPEGVLYAIVDFVENVRGPCNLIFGPPKGIVTADGPEEGIDDLMRLLVEDGGVYVSRRTGVPLEIALVNGFEKV